MTDPYAVLGLPADAEDETIRRRYLELVKQFSPEHHPDKFAQIRQAYEKMRDLETRLKHRLFEAGKTDSIDAIIEDLIFMSDISPSLDAASPGELGAEVLNAEAIDTILADFRAWLQDAKDAPAVAEPAPQLDVATVVQQFIALRQEVNLQTKSTRAQTDQAGQTIAMMQEALGELQRQHHLLKQNDKSGQDEALRPLLKTLVDAYDALSLAEREVRRLLDNAPTMIAPVPVATSPPVPPPTIKLKIPHWARWIGLDASVEAQLAPLHRWVAAQSGVPAPIYLDDSAQRYRQSLDALLVGYRMSLQRIDRALTQQGLEVIACVGEPFDPETMEVAEVVREEGRTSTEVLQEIRRGYRWRGRLFRYAHVRVAKP